MLPPNSMLARTISLGKVWSKTLPKLFHGFKRPVTKVTTPKDVSVCRLCVVCLCCVVPATHFCCVFLAFFFMFAAGMSQASFNLGQMYFNGRGVEENHGKGVALMEKASSLGNKDATQVLVDIEKEAKGALKEGRVVDGARVVEEEAKVEEGVVVNGKK